MDIYTEFRTESLPAAERFGAWYDLTLRSFVPSLVSGDPKADFRATTHILALGAVQVSSVAVPTLEMHRPTRLIRRSDPEHLMMWLHLGGTFEISTGGRSCVVRPREMVIYDSSEPYHGLMLADRKAFSGIVVQMPRSLLPIEPAAARRLLGQRLPGTTGIGAILAQYLVGLVGHARESRPVDAARLASITLELLTTLLASHDPESTMPAETCAQALQLRIHDFIQRHIDEPDLSPDVIAAAHRISTRYLHRLFQEQGLTVAAWVRQRRLERCRNDLADPSQRHRTVQSIASRWGLPNAAHFSRLFRAAYGMSPRDYRQTSADRLAPTTTNT